MPRQGFGGGGPVAFTFSSLSAGTHQIVASYGGDSANSPSASAPLTQTVNATATTTTLTSSLNPSSPGQQITLTATVTGNGPTGTVYFIDTTTSAGYGPYTLSGGTAALTFSSLASGSHQFTASYSGGIGNSSSTSPAFTQIVNTVNTTTTLTSNFNPSVFGQPVTFTAAVPLMGVRLTGTVTFTIDGTALPPVTLNGNGTAAYTASGLAVGSHAVTAAYSGDANFSPSTSSPLTQTVNVHVAPQYVSPSGSDGNDGSQAAPKLTIQAAINATIDGDTVFIADGTYTGPGDMDLDFGGRNITVTSKNGPSSTIIDCQGSAASNHRGFNLHSGETSAVISGLTIQNGFVGGNGGGGSGGGIYNSAVGLTVQNCILKNNTASYGSGGGFYNNVADSGRGTNTSGTAVVTNCIFIGNAASDGGGGLYNFNFGSTITVTNCTFSGNTTPASTPNGGGGGGIYNANYNYPPGNGTITLTNDIVYGDTGGEVINYGSGSSNVNATFCDIQGGYAGTGNINADPLFFNAPADLHLQAASPCLGAGTPNGAPATTIDGRTRPNPPSIGAYEAAQTGATATTTTLASSLNPSAFGQSVTFTATVAGAGGMPTGAVTFSVDGAAQPSVTLSNGTAAFSVFSLSVGSHTVTAAYSGDANFAPSAAPAITQTVNRVPTTTALTSSLNPSHLWSAGHFHRDRHRQRADGNRHFHRHDQRRDARHRNPVRGNRFLDNFQPDSRHSSDCGRLRRRCQQRRQHIRRIRADCQPGLYHNDTDLQPQPVCFRPERHLHRHRRGKRGNADGDCDLYH